MIGQLWKSAIALTGLAGVAAFVFWSLYSNWLKLPIFSQLNSGQTFVLMLVFLIVAFAALLLMLVTYMVTRGQSAPASAAAGHKNAPNVPPDDFADTLDQLWRHLPHGSVLAYGLGKKRQQEVLRRINLMAKTEGQARGYHFYIVDIDVSRTSEDKFFAALKKTIEKIGLSLKTNNSNILQLYLTNVLDELQSKHSEGRENWRLVLALTGCDEGFPQYIETDVFANLRSLVDGEKKNFSIVLLAENREPLMKSRAGHFTNSSPLMNILFPFNFADGNERRSSAM
jgi:hypothetical protein